MQQPAQLLYRVRVGENSTLLLSEVRTCTLSFTLARNLPVLYNNERWIEQFRHVMAGYCPGLSSRVCSPSVRPSGCSTALTASRLGHLSQCGCLLHAAPLVPSSLGGEQWSCAGHWLPSKMGLAGLWPPCGRKHGESSSWLMDAESPYTELGGGGLLGGALAASSWAGNETLSSCLLQPPLPLRLGRLFRRALVLHPSSRWGFVLLVLSFSASFLWARAAVTETWSVVEAFWATQGRLFPPWVQGCWVGRRCSQAEP